MLAYPVDEASTLLDGRLSNAKKSLENCEEDLEFLREQITVCWRWITELIKKYGADIMTDYGGCDSQSVQLGCSSEAEGEGRRGCQGQGERGIWRLSWHCEIGSLRRKFVPVMTIVAMSINALLRAWRDERRLRPLKGKKTRFSVLWMHLKESHLGRTKVGNKADMYSPNDSSSPILEISGSQTDDEETDVISPFNDFGAAPSARHVRVTRKCFVAVGSGAYHVS